MLEANLPTNPSDSQELTNLTQNKLFPWLIALVIALTSVSFAAGYSLGKKPQSVGMLPTPATATPSPTPIAPAATPNLEPIIDPTPKPEPQKRLYDSMKPWFDGSQELYPSEMTAIANSALESLTCGPVYNLGNPGDSKEPYYLAEAENETGQYREMLDDEALLTKIKTLSQTLNSDDITSNLADQFVACQTTSGKQLIITEFFAGGGGGNNQSYFSLYNKDALVSASVQLKNPGLAYFNCRHVDQLTTSNTLYVGCGGGDGGSGGAGLYRVNFTPPSVKLLRACVSQIDGTTFKEKTTCGADYGFDSFGESG